MSLKNWVFIAVIYHLIWWDSDHNTWFNFLLFPPLFLNRIDGNIINVSTLLRYLKPALYLDTHLHTQKYTNKRLSLIYSSLLQQATLSCTSWRSFHSFKRCTVNGTKFISCCWVWYLLFSCDNISAKRSPAVLWLIAVNSHSNFTPPLPPFNHSSIHVVLKVLQGHYTFQRNLHCSPNFILFFTFLPLYEHDWQAILIWSFQQNRFHTETLPLSTCASSGSLCEDSQFIR